MDNYIQVKPTQYDWTRPSDWLPMPSYTANEEVFHGLHAVFESDINPCAVIAYGTGAGYTVDWGDGTTSNVAFSTQAQKVITWASISSSTLTSRGYRQALVKITPQSGATITGINFGARHTSYPYGYDTLWLDVIINFATFNQVSPLNWNSLVTPGYLERIYIKTFTNANLEYLFWGARALQVVNAFDTSHCTSAFQMFNNCLDLQYVPNFNFSNITNASNMFLGCLNLQKIDTNDFKKVTNGSGMFWLCNIRDVSNIQFRDITSMYLMFYPAGIVESYPDFSLCTGIVGNVDYSIYPTNTNYIPQIALGGVTTASNFLYGMPARRIRKSLITGFKFTHSYVNQLLSTAEIDNIFTNLGTANASASITITGNPGAGGATTSIATSKGWTVIN